MKVHEFQAKKLFRDHGIPVPDGTVVEKEADLAGLAAHLSGNLFVVKAQIHAGGRGKGTAWRDGTQVGRGVQVVRTPDEAVRAARSLLGATLVTIQTGASGRVVHKVLVENGVDIDREFYLAAILDRETASVALMASAEGGTEIEEVAHKTPERIHKVRINPLLGYREFHGRNLATKLGLSGEAVTQFVRLAGNLVRLFLARDCSLAEVNPLVRTRQGNLMAIDGKLNFDDNAMFRQETLAELRDVAEEEPSEVEADMARLTYIKLDGSIGCLVNGAGLAMATMDIIKDCGGEPANFLDVGGTATAENVAKSFDIMLRDHVRGIFVNVFGGIVRCDVVAQGLVDALSRVKLDIPLVVRLEGNRKAEALAILAGSGLPLITAADMRDGATKIVAACARG